MTNPEDFNDFREGDEPEDTNIDGFKVYGGAPTDREKLLVGDPEFISQLQTALRETFRDYPIDTSN